MFSLTENMRIKSSGYLELQSFNAWTLSIGNGDNDMIRLLPNMLITKIERNRQGSANREGESMQEFCRKVFPEIGQSQAASRDGLAGRAILTTTNKEVASLNEVVSDMLPGEYEVFSSADTIENCQDLLMLSM